MSETWHEPAEQRRLAFESIVLRILWLIVRILILKDIGHRDGADRVRIDILNYFDLNGRPGEVPKKYRRETTFPEIPW